MPTTLTADQLARDLALRDLTDPVAGPHAIQLLADLAVGALVEAWRCEVRNRKGTSSCPPRRQLRPASLSTRCGDT